jgi:hypothetical protein
VQIRTAACRCYNAPENHIPTHTFKNGTISLLQYLHYNFSPQGLFFALNFGTISLLQYLHYNFSPQGLFFALNFPRSIYTATVHFHSNFSLRHLSSFSFSFHLFILFLVPPFHIFELEREILENAFFVMFQDFFQSGFV